MNVRTLIACLPQTGTAALLLALTLAAPAAHAQACMEDSDCEAGYECDRAPAACTDDGSGTPDCEPPEGECEPGRITCVDDADCPQGLSCETQERGDVSCTSAAPPSGAGAGDAGAADESCDIEEDEPAQAYCVYAPVVCDDDDACDADFSCQVLGSESRCHSEPGTCTPGGDCSEPTEVCEEEQPIRYCFPVRQDCEDDGDCDGGWTCTALPDDVQEDAPSGWVGATDICVPEGIALLLAGNVEVADSFTSASRDEASQSTNSASGSDAAEDVPTRDADDNDDDDAMSGGAQDSSSGCSVAHGARSATHTGLGAGFLLALGLLFARRRR